MTAFLPLKFTNKSIASSVEPLEYIVSLNLEESSASKTSPASLKASMASESSTAA